MSERENDFLSRWSRRKADARGGGLRKKESEPAHRPGRMRTDAPRPKEADPASAEEAGPEVAALKDEQAAPAAETPAREVVPETEETVDPAQYEDFDFDSLDYASDYTRFMQKGVPEAVRRRALRMLWKSNPVLANVDGLNDYDEDFTDAALVLKTFASSYKPGSGYLTEEERMASYSDEAREAGAEKEVAEADAEAPDVDDMDTAEDAPGEARTASAGTDGDGDGEDTSEDKPGEARTASAGTDGDGDDKDTSEDGAAG